MLPATNTVGSSERMAERFARMLTRYDERVKALAEQLTAGEITLSEWRTAMGREILFLHGLAWQFAQAEPDTPNALQQAWIEERVAAQLLYLDRWAQALALIEQARLNATQITARGKLYAGAAWETMFRAYASRLGIEGLPAYPGSGTPPTTCGTACRCRLDIQRVGDEYHIRWRLDPRAEHCGGCETFARTWNPLRIRNGVVIQAE